MKKTTLAIGIVAVLGIGYVGTAWYTGNTIKSDIDSKLKEITEQVNQSQDMFNVEITYNNYEKNIFSTDLHLTVSLLPKDTATQDVEPKKIFDDNITIHHGPFPIAALSKGTFTPQMAWIDYQMSEQTSPELWKLAGNQPPLNGSIGLSYQQYLTVKVSNKAIKLYNSDFDFIEGELDISAGEHYFGMNKDFTNISISNYFDNLAYKINDNNYVLLNKFEMNYEPNIDKTIIDYKIGFGDLAIHIDEVNPQATIKIDNFKSKGKFNYQNQDVEVESSIDQFKYEPDSTQSDLIPTIIFKNLQAKQNNKLNATNRLDGALSTSVKSLQFGQQNIGSASLDIDYQNVNRKSLSGSFAEFYDDEFDDNQESNIENNPSNMKISLNKFNWHNAEGDININGLMDIKLGDNDDLSSSQDIDKVNNFKLKVEAPFKVIARTIAQFENPKESDVTKKQIEKADLTIQMMSQMFLSNVPLINFNKGETKGVYADIDYAKDREEVMVNGNKLNKEDFLNQLK